MVISLVVKTLFNKLQVAKFRESLFVKVWLLDENGKVNFSSPFGTVSKVWPGLSTTPDAGFTWTNGLTYLFSGKL